MTTIWVLERDKSMSLSRALSGGFAIRSVASPESLQTLIALNRQSSPRALVIDIDDYQTSLERVWRAVAASWRHVLVVNVGTSAPREVPSTCKSYYMSRPVDCFALAMILRGAEPVTGTRERCLVFRDIELNLDSFVCRFTASGDETALTVKEARILGFLISKAGTCVSRDDIRAAIWERIAVSPRTIDSHVSRLRRHLSQSEVCVEGVYGGGYVLR